MNDEIKDYEMEFKKYSYVKQYITILNDILSKPLTEELYKAIKVRVLH